MPHRRAFANAAARSAWIVAIIAVAACASDTSLLAPERGGVLVGTWQTARSPQQPQGSMQGTWTVGADGRIEQRTVLYGVYEGEGPNDVSADIRQFGRIGASATAFVVRLDSTVTHDAFYGPNHRDVQRYPLDVASAPRDSTHYEIVGDALQLTYYSYPADAPVLTHGTMTRVR
jgi:hypothetical protein